MSDLEFDRAESPGTKTAAPIQCADCARPIQTAYFEANGKILCAPCKGRVATSLGGSGSYLRGVVFGLGAALLGAAIYFAVAAITGYEVGLIAILVGFMVGQGVRIGSRSSGGRKFQVTAVALTYFAVGLSYGGLLIKEAAKGAKLTDVRQAGLAPAPSQLAQSPAEAGAADSTASAAQLGAAAIPVGLAALVVLIFTLPVAVVLGGLPGSLLSALIVGFGLVQAWKLNQKVTMAISGPFAVGSPPQKTPQ